MNPHLEALIRLQEIDLRILELNRQASEFPQKIVALQQELGHRQVDALALKEQLESSQKERRKLEGEADLLRPRLSKYKDQLMEVKTNKEYQAVLKEIEGCKEEITQKEDIILDHMERVERLEREIKILEATYRQEEEQVRRQENDYKKSSAAIQVEIEQLATRKADLERFISQDLLERYKTLAQLRRGIALAEARDESCTVCHVKLRPQVFNDVRRNDQILSCESCNRILYYRGNAQEAFV
ncbi:MAG: hypothetical protein HY652_14740 [Acidobacteria bacterium]|nr:hypothetical protein [Acidobacteriota bacterium]